MRTVFFGTPEWAVPSLDALIASDVDVAAVVTNPDRPAGRGMKLTPSPVKTRALEAGLEVLQPVKARTPELHERLQAIGPDVAVVVAYGKILPASLLAIPRHGFVNVHFSILPAYRGAAPVQRAIMDGVRVTGVSLMVLTEGMDEGPVLAVAEEPVSEDDTAGTVGPRLADLGAGRLVPTLVEYASGDLEPAEQDHERATYAPKITESEARIDWTWSASRIKDHVRALDPSPGAWTTVEDKRLKVFRAEPTPGRDDPPGHLSVMEGKLIASCGEGAVELVEVQPAGKRRMSGPDMARGLRAGSDLMLE